MSAALMTFRVDQLASGIYHLIRDGEVIYIGASANLLQRIYSWIGMARAGYQSRWYFDRIAIYPTPIADLAVTELEHIQHYRPTLNHSGLTMTYRGCHRWQKYRSALVIAGDNGDFLSRLDYVASLPEIVRLNHLIKLKLTAGSREEHLLQLESIGLCPPFLENGRDGHLRWRREDVLQWLKNIGPFDDELPASGEGA